ncbi:MAG: hypothetical protein GY866_33720 [Proteobacteria bacterium]|nr:hypothetical protein [Pseudomonadota bacterium]
MDDRFEIRLLADRKASEYQNTEKLIGFLHEFDFEGLEAVGSKKIGILELKKYIPKL